MWLLFLDEHVLVCVGVNANVAIVGWLYVAILIPNFSHTSKKNERR